MRTPRPLPIDVEELARVQEGLITYRQLLDQGVDKGRVARMASQKRLVTVTRGVFDTILLPVRDRRAPGDLDRRRRRAAILGLLAYGSSAVATGACALALHGVQGLPVQITPEVLLTDGFARRRRDGITVHRYQVRSVATARGWPAVGVEDGLVQAVPALGRRRALAALDSARQLGLVDAAGVARAHERARGRPGVRRTHDVWGLSDERAESPVESAARLACVDAEVPPDVLQLEFTSPDGRVVARCDLAWWLGGDRWLVAEVDGKDPHSTPEALFRDRRRQNALLSSGRVQVVRITSDEAWGGALPRLVQPILRRAGWAPGRIVPPGPVRL